MTVKDALKQLESLGNEKTRKQNAKQGCSDNQYGVKLGDIRKLADKIKTDHKLALELWETGNADARFLAALIIDVKQLSAKDLDRMARSVTFVRVADWLDSYVIRKHADKEKLREKWMASDKPMLARFGWSLTSERVGKAPDGLDLPGLLDRIEAEMSNAAPEEQWTMNMALATIGIRHDKLRKRAIKIGEKLGVYRDYPVAKGCTSPFAPIWIDAMVKRNG